MSNLALRQWKLIGNPSFNTINHFKLVDVVRLYRRSP